MKKVTCSNKKFLLNTISPGNGNDAERQVKKVHKHRHNGNTLSGEGKYRTSSGEG